MLPTEYLDMRQAPFNSLYLQRLGEVLQHALDEHPRTLAIRIDLRLSPDWWQADTVSCHPNLSGDLMSRFIRSLKSRIRHYRQRLTRRRQRAHICTLRYFWVREIVTAGYPHYHAVLFLNKDLFRGIGHYRGEAQSLGGMIQDAWLSALDLREHDEYRSLVHFPKNATYVIDRYSPRYEELLASLVYRISYLAKEDTKVYSRRERSMGCSLR